MAEYIEREKVIKALHDNTVEMEQTIAYPSNIGVPEDDIEDIINEIPAADVVEVVRCGQCRHATDDIIVEGVCYCHKIQQGMFLDGFCSYGEGRKE